MDERRTLSALPAKKIAIALAVIAALCGGICPGAEAQGNAPGSISLPTELRVQKPGWWPTKGDAVRDEFVGTAACAQCHASKADTYPSMSMAHAGFPAADSERLHQHGHLAFELGRYGYQIAANGENSILSVTDGTSTLSRTLIWAFGFAHMGQTYIYEQNGSLYESHVSFYAGPQALDITPGQSHAIPVSLEEAAGRRMEPSEVRLCFGCHTTASTTKNEFDARNLFPGVTCEACHGPGARHVLARETGTEEEGAAFILNPGRLSPVESVDFCGACHRTWEDVVKNGLIGLGVFNVRFAPYRLENSRCWGTGDARITCTACHDPHKPLVTDVHSYDAYCRRCHILRGAKRTRDHPGADCRVSTENCVTCHMPKYEPPGLHSAFTDHWIRIVQPGKPYPN